MIKNRIRVRIKDRIRIMSKIQIQMRINLAPEWCKRAHLVDQTLVKLEA